MARKTKAEREAELLEYRNQLEDMNRRAYPAILMNTLERSTDCCFELKVSDGKFVVVERNSPANDWSFEYEYSPGSIAALDRLRWEVEKQEMADSSRRCSTSHLHCRDFTDDKRKLLGL